MRLLKAGIISAALIATTFGINAVAADKGKPAAKAETAKADLTNAKKLFTQNCATCHGPQGKGDGPAAAGLNPKPADFSKGVFKYGGKDPELANTIKKGKGMMPPWGGILKDKDVNDLVHYIHTLKK